MSAKRIPLLPSAFVVSAQSPLKCQHTQMPKWSSAEHKTKLESLLMDIGIFLLSRDAWPNAYRPAFGASSFKTMPLPPKQKAAEHLKTLSRAP